MTRVLPPAAVLLLLPVSAAWAQPQRADADAAPCDKPHAAGIAAYAVRSHGTERDYVLVVPEGYDGRTRSPLVLTFHGSGSNAEQQLAIADLAAAAGERGWLVVAPAAVRPWPSGGSTWNVPFDSAHPDDVAFVGAMLEDVGERVCVDDVRVYATGFSGGARFSSLLACELDDRIAAIGAVGGLRRPEGCAASRAVPVIAFHGTADPVNPYDGGGSAYWGESVEAAVDGWGAAHGGERVEETLSPTLARIAYRAGAGRGEDVVLYRIDGAGHVWPGTPFELPETLGPSTDEIDATESMLTFFERHVLP